MAEYLQTMEHFLEVQEEVMQGYLTAGRGPAGVDQGAQEDAPSVGLPRVEDAAFASKSVRSEGAMPMEPPSPARLEARRWTCP